MMDMSNEPSQNPAELLRQMVAEMQKKQDQTAMEAEADSMAIDSMVFEELDSEHLKIVVSWLRSCLDASDGEIVARRLAFYLGGLEAAGRARKFYRPLEGLDDSGPDEAGQTAA